MTSEEQEKFIDGPDKKEENEEDWVTEPEPESDSDSDSNSSDEEDIFGRRGYCTINPGDSIGKYKAIKELGGGNFSKVWLASNHDKEYAIKIIKCRKSYNEQAIDEVKFYGLIRENGGNPNIVTFYESFMIIGQYGEHSCLVFEVLCGSVLKRIENKPMTIEESKFFARDILEGLQYLHSLKIIITDLKPENILKVPGSEDDQQDHYKIVDLGNACFTYKHITDDVCTRQYRPPEITVGVKYGTPIDIWSFACVLFEVITGEFLFDPRKRKDYSSSYDHMRLIEELLGKYPKHLRKDGIYNRDYYTRKDELKYVKVEGRKSIKERLINEFCFKEEDAKDLEDFLLLALNYNPNKRATAKDLLGSKWLNYK